MPPLIVSLPAPPIIVSAEEPPVMESLPKLPVKANPVELEPALRVNPLPEVMALKSTL